MKNLKRLILGAGLLLCVQYGLAQKSAPVVGDAATLIDLLKKGYNSVAEGTRQEELVRDRAQVIGIFQAYLSEGQRVEYAGKFGINEKNEFALLKQAQNVLSKEKAALEAVKAVQIKYDEKQNPVDAKSVFQKVAQLNDSVKKRDSVLSVLQFSSDTAVLKTLNSILLVENPYLAHVVEKFEKKYQSIQDYGQDPYAKSNHVSSLQKGLPFLGGALSFDAAIKGLSQFLAKRLKEELVGFAMERVKEWLEVDSAGNRFEEFKVLLPRTTNFLSNFQADQIANFPSEIKQYIEDDFNHLLENAINLEKTARFQKVINAHPNVKIAFSAFEMIPRIAQLQNPIDFFDVLESSKLVQDWQSPDSSAAQFNISNTLRMSSLLAHSMMVVESGQARLASTSVLSNYVGDFDFQLLYLGMLHQQNLKYYQIEFRSANSKTELKLETVLKIAMEKYEPDSIEASATALRKVSSLLIAGTRSAGDVFAQASSIRKANKLGKSVGADTVQAFVGSLIDFAEEVTTSGDALMDFLKVPHEAKLEETGAESLIGSLNLTKKAKPFFTAARTTNEIILDLRQKRYAVGMLKAIALPRLVSGAKETNVPENLRKLIHFINDMALAESPDDMEQAIEAFALPAGSYSIKRKTRFNLALQSYPGILMGATHLIKEDGKLGRGKFTPSFTAPVGLNFSLGTPNGWSHSVYLSVIDIGALTRYYFDNNDSTETLPEVSFRNVFAPGLYYCFGIKKTPISINFGVQMGPELTEIMPDRMKVSETLRWGGGITVDIPLLNFYSKPLKKEPKKVK